MVKPIEKLIKIEQPRKISEMQLNSIEIFPAIPKLDLMDIELCTESSIAVQVDLGLDQIEEE
jgi:hypothetical protein